MSRCYACCQENCGYSRCTCDCHVEKPETKPTQSGSMVVPTIKELMREQAKLVKYQDGKLWYQILYTEGGAYSGGRPRLFDFPIDVTGEDAGGEFGSNEKAITLMRWIRKHIEFLKEAHGQTS